MSTHAATGGDAIRPFSINVPEAELTELRRRINATRWPDRETDASQGVQLATMQELARYWATEYDWRMVEGRMARSTGLLSISSRPSARKRSRPARCLVA